MFLSVIVATYNRCESLKDTLDSLVAQVDGHDLGVEIIVVDNNSSDKTKEVVESYQAKFSELIKYIFEGEQGKSFALNHGIKIAKGEVVAFTDDDCLVSEDWLVTIFETFKKYNMDCIGGKIKLKWFDKIPVWFDERMLNDLGYLDYGDVLFEVKTFDSPFYGCNFAFKRELFEKYGYFDVRLGPKGKLLSRNEDTEIVKRFLRREAKVYYQPRLFIYHKVIKDRIKKEYFRELYFETGKSSSKNNIVRDKDFRQILNVPIWRIRVFFGDLLKYLQCIVFRKKESFYRELRLLFFFGYVRDRLSMKI